MQEKVQITAVSITETEPSVSGPSNGDSSTALLSALQHQAEEGTRAEHELTVREALRKWPKAVVWSVVFSSTIIMEGYDTALINAFWGYPAFQAQFGSQYTVQGSPDSEGAIAYQVSAPWQSGISSSILVTNILGVLISGSLADRYGYRKVFLGSLFLIIILIFGTFFSRTMPALYISETLCGLPWGAFSTLGPAYASEIAPVALRGYLTTYVNLCWIIGQLIATGVLKSLVTRMDEWGYRIPFAIQWVWPLPIILALIFAPESPWYHVRQGDFKRAKSALKKLCRPELVNVETHLSMMIHTNELEKTISSGTSYLDCFKGIDLRRTECSCMAWSIQTLCGNPFSGQAIYFFTIAGISTSTAYSLGVGVYALGFCGTVISWYLMSRMGRRTLFLGGLITLTILMFGIGVAASVASLTTSSSIASAAGAGGRANRSSSSLVQASLMIIWVFIYDLTVGPQSYSLVTELSSTRLRAKTVGLARVLYNMTGLLANLIQPYFLNPSALNFGGRIGYIWGAVSFGCCVWTWFRLPEPRGRTYQELDILFQARVPARAFRDYKIVKLGLGT